MADIESPEERENRREKRRAWYAKNREAILRKNAEWREKSGYKAGRAKPPKPYSELSEEQKEQKRAYKRAWAARNPERVRSYFKAWLDKLAKPRKQKRPDASEDAKEAMRAYHRARYRKDPEKSRAKSRAYYHANLEKSKARNRAWIEAHREERNARQRAYYYANRDRLLAYARDYQARVRRISKAAPQYEELRRKALLANPFYAAADAAISRSLTPFMRSDIISMIVEAGYKGELKVEDVPGSARAFISQYYRDYGSVYGTASLDDVIPGTDLKAIDSIVYEGAGVGFEGDDGPDDEDAFFMDEMV